MSDEPTVKDHVDRLRHLHAVATSGFCSHGVRPDHCHETHDTEEDEPSPGNPVIRHADMPGGPEFDEFIAKGADIHLEAMGDCQWWIGVKVGDRMWHINVGAKSARAKGYAICEEDA